MYNTRINYDKGRKAKKKERTTKMKVVKYELVYSDGRNYREYASPMTMDKAKLKIAELVARHFAGSPAIDYTDWGSGEI